MKSAVMALVAGALLATACSNSGPVDFGRSAEKFIQGSTVEKKANTTFTNASCSEPAAVKAGENFNCTATAADGSTWEFQMVVKDAHNFELISGGKAPG